MAIHSKQSINKLSNTLILSSPELKDVITNLVELQLTPYVVSYIGICISIGFNYVPYDLQTIVNI
jgi:hypothetical protein